MKKYIFILFTIGIFLEGIAQDEEASEYFPLSAGNKWHYEFTSSPNWMKFKITDDEVNRGGKSYSELNIKYSWGENSNAYYRYEEGQYYTFSGEQDREMIHIPKNPKTGYKWSHNDGWMFEIMGTAEHLRTPVQNYTDLLKVRATQVEHKDKEKGQEYFLYFQKGVGQVASYMDGQLQTYLTKYKIVK